MNLCMVRPGVKQKTHFREIGKWVVNELFFLRVVNPSEKPNAHIPTATN